MSKEINSKIGNDIREYLGMLQLSILTHEEIIRNDKKTIARLKRKLKRLELGTPT